MTAKSHPDLALLDALQAQNQRRAGERITDARRTLGQGAVSDVLLGDGYVRDIVGLIDASCPGHELTVHNTGIGGITTNELTSLWDEDVLPRNGE